MVFLFPSRCCEHSTLFLFLFLECHLQPVCLQASTPNSASEQAVTCFIWILYLFLDFTLYFPLRYFFPLNLYAFWSVLLSFFSFSRFYSLHSLLCGFSCPLLLICPLFLYHSLLCWNEKRTSEFILPQQLTLLCLGKKPLLLSPIDSLICLPALFVCYNSKANRGGKLQHFFSFVYGSTSLFYLFIYLVKCIPCPVPP